MKISYYEVIGSTNDVLLESARCGQCIYDEAAVAFAQTNGRGRRGRSFFSPDSTGLYMSLLLHPELDISKAGYITTMMAVAASEVLEEYTGSSMGIKWVNDLYVGTQKVAGILTECSPTFTNGVPDYLVVGIGINLYDPKEGLPEDIRDRAGSVFGLLPSDMDEAGLKQFRTELAGKIIDRFVYYYQKPGEKGWHEGYVKRMFLTGRSVVAYDNDNHTENLKVLGVDEEFGLVVCDESLKQKVLRTGEVSLKI